MNKPYLSDAEKVIEEVKTDFENGLTSEEAKARLEKYGLNKLAEGKKTPLWKRFFAQMADPMIIMLLCAAVISAFVGMASGENQTADVIIIPKRPSRPCRR